MCSCHTKLKRGEASNIGPATAELRHEHEVILRALVVLERAGERLAAGTPVDEAALTELVALIRLFADTCHHGKEEGQLFPALREKGVGATLSVFLDDHVEGRGYLTTLAGGAAAAARASAARRYVGLLRDHIQREDEVLFPMADDVLSQDEHAELARRYAEVEEQVVGPGVHDKLLATLDRLEAAIPPEARA
ncbi:MAG: hemerythrin domain-containing protein [Candidatus Rokubacteria bacterium]|nr:hemerythrin domain-containing protein [Candidatus Rokubacteria bacterium]